MSLTDLPFVYNRYKSYIESMSEPYKSQFIKEVYEEYVSSKFVEKSLQTERMANIDDVTWSYKKYVTKPNICTWNFDASDEDSFDNYAQTISNYICALSNKHHKIITITIPYCDDKKRIVWLNFPQYKKKDITKDEGYLKNFLTGATILTSKFRIISKM